MIFLLLQFSVVADAEMRYYFLSYTYYFIVILFPLFSREVWCERSDGLRVSNGCNLAVKPSTTQSCQPKCTVSNSFCNAETICVCKNNYIPIIGSHGRLIHCLSDSNSLLNRTMDTGISTSRSNGSQSSSCKSC